MFDYVFLPVFGKKAIIIVFFLKKNMFFLCNCQITTIFAPFINV